MNLKGVAIAVYTATIMFTGCAPALTNQYGNPVGLYGASAAVIHVGPVKTSYHDNTRATPDTVHSDSFLIEAAQGLLLFETAKVFGLAGATEQAASMDSATAPPHYSILEKWGEDSARSAEMVREIAATFGARYVVSPCEIAITYRVNQPAGWRNDKYGGSYARPVSYSAFTVAHIQVWDSSGALVLESKGQSGASRSLLYGLFTRRRERETDIVEMASRFYSSPIVKSMHQSIQQALAGLKIRG